MRVAIVTNHFPTLSETFVVSHVCALLDAGHTVDIVASPGGLGQVQPEVAARRLTQLVRYRQQAPASPILRAAVAARIVAQGAMVHPRRVLGALNVFRHGRHAGTLRLLYRAVPFLALPNHDLIHCEFGTVGAEIAELKRRGLVDAPLVVSFRGYDATRVVSQRRDGYYRTLFEQAALVLPVSHSLAERLEALGCDPRKMRVFPTPIATDRFAFRPRSRPQNRPWNLLSVGRLTEKKGFDVALRALAIVARAQPGWEWRYAIVGSGPLQEPLARLSAELGLDARVGFHPAVPADRLMTGHYAEADVLIAPSRTAGDGDEEGIPNVLKEAMALGIPAISTRHAGIPELIRHGEEGLLAAPGDAADLAKSLLRLFDPMWAWAPMLAAARRRVEADYDAIRLNAVRERLYGEVVALAGRQCIDAKPGSPVVAR